MRIDPIYDEYPEACAERTYLVEVAKRLSRVIGDELDELATVALIDLLATRRIDLADGFVVNDERKLVHTLGYEEASIVGACLSRSPARPPAAWKATRLNTQDDDRLREAMTTLENRLGNHPSVAKVA